jgi:hypothetical protein
MNGNRGWFSRLAYSMKMGLGRFMAGRYGTDKLNTCILVMGLIFCLISMLLPAGWPVLLLTGMAYACSFTAIFRSFSRNTYKRYRENRWYLGMVERLKDREHRYYSCPKCRQSVRVPKGKGKIAITCPRCREKFIKKT